MKSNKFIKQHFENMFKDKNEVLDTFKRGLGIKDSKIANIIKNAKPKDKICLDIGPGNGRWINFFKGFDCKKIFALDISENVKEKCQGLCDDFFLMDLENQAIPIKSNSVDIIIAIEVIEHIRDSEEFLKEILRVSKPGGLILLTMPNIVSLISRIRMFFGILPVAISSDKTHVKFYRQKDIKKILLSLNYKVKFHPTSFSLNPMNPKSKLRIKSNSFLSSFDDSHLFTIYK